MRKFGFVFFIFLAITSLVYAQSSSVDIESLAKSHITTIVSVSTTAVAVPTSALAGRKTIYVENLSSSVTVYIGNENVTADETSTGGKPLASGVGVTLDFTDDIVVYARTSSGSANVLTWEAR